MKWLGALCIAGAAVWGRWQQLDLSRRQRETQERMTAALRQMAEEIRVARTPMPALLDWLGRSCDGEAGGFFQTAAEGLRRGRELGAAWRRALACLDLPAEEMTALRELRSWIPSPTEK